MLQYKIQENVTNIFNAVYTVHCDTIITKCKSAIIQFPRESATCFEP